MANVRVVGLETEYGIALKPQTPAWGNTSSEALSVAIAQAVRTWQASLRADGQAIGWDWEGENPLRDLRGTQLERASAHPSLLTDDPHSFAPSGDTVPDVSPGDGPTGQAETFAVEELAGQNSPLLTNAVMTNGGRFYVDHAHPEYSTPEVANSRDAVVWDLAGEHLAQKAMAVAATQGHEIVLFKNNTDSKGSAYGSHENYLVSRDLPFQVLRDFMLPFLVTRPLLCGAGRVGLGQHSEEPGFQISQRADFIADEVGLQTTFNRPIINTRDEPHASPKWRRFHVINGDANRFPASILVKVASTRAILAALEAAWLSGETTPPLHGFFLEQDPVEAVWQVSRDHRFETTLKCADGKTRDALTWQWEVANEVAAYLAKAPDAVLNDQAREDVAIWVETLRMLRKDPGAAATRVEWVAKRELFTALGKRLSAGWSDPKLAALDIQWADLRPGRSPVDKLRQTGRMENICDVAEASAAATTPPQGTRARARGEAIATTPDLVAASWETLVVKAGAGQLTRVKLPDPAVYLPAGTH